MQKKLLAIAVGATIAAAPMFAQADVVLKGRIETELANTDGGDTLTGETYIDSVTRQGDYNGQSRWLIDASKDLGNGLKAIGRLSWQLNPSDGADQKARDQYVGLAGGWGAFVAGRLPTPYKMNGGVKWDPYTATFLQARGQGGMSSSSLGHNSFVNDVLAYVMPELGGVNATFAYVADNSEEPVSYEGTYTMGGTGKWGPIEAMLAYTDASLHGTAITDKQQVKQFKGGVRYVGNGLTAAYQYENVDYAGPVKINGLSTGFNGGDIAKNLAGIDNGGTFNYFNLGYKFGNTLISGNYGFFSGDEYVNDVDYGAIGLTYFFDKKVRVYGGWSGTDIKKVSGTPQDGVGTFNTWGAGLRYDF